MYRFGRIEINHFTWLCLVHMYQRAIRLPNLTHNKTFAYDMCENYFFQVTLLQGLLTRDGKLTIYNIVKKDESVYSCAKGTANGYIAGRIALIVTARGE